MRVPSLLLLGAATLSTTLSPAVAARAADDAAPHAEARGTITIPAGTGRVMHLRAAASNIFTADPKIAEVRPASPDSLFVWGVSTGTTTIAALSNTGEAVAQFQVTVVPSGYNARQLNVSPANVTPDTREPLRARETPQGISLGGKVRTPADAERAVNAAKAQLPVEGKVDDHLAVAEPTQVALHVRIAEMNRTLTRELGVNWTANGAAGALGRFGVETVNPVADSTVTPSSITAGLFHHANLQLEATIQALADDQLIHLLAEPNLTTMSGEPANFLVGGEFPIPVATNTNTISVDFKQYGISLSFVPTVLSHDQIMLHVRPEVSQLDKANGVTFFFGIGNTATGLSIPALTVRRADTTVQLGSGQSFVIAGLLQDQITLTGNSLPGLG